MPLTLNFGGAMTSATLRRVDAVYEICSGGSVSGVRLDVPLKLDHDLDPAGYHSHVFFSGDVRESDIYQLIDKGSSKRLGWFIPLLALESALHDYADNEHFLRYARAATEQMFDVFPQAFVDEGRDLLASDGVRLSSVFPDATVFIVLSDGALRDFPDFSITRLLPSLAALGILADPDIDSSGPFADFCRPSDLKKLKLSQSSLLFAGDRLVVSLVALAVRSAQSPVLQFFYLYQIFELLMEKIFESEQRSIVDKIVAAKGSVHLVKDALDQLSEFLSEKRRINAILDKYCDPRPDVSEMIQACRALNQKLGLQSEETLAKSLYSLRNLLFHSYRSFSRGLLPDLAEVNGSIVATIPDIFSSFCIPQAR